MDVAVADERFAVPRCKAYRQSIEVGVPRIHGIALDRIEQIGVTFEIPSEARARRKERMRRDDEARLARLQTREIRERAHGVGAALEVQQQHVLAFNRPFDAADEDQSALGGVRHEAREVELVFV
jgi:hypothetical protein